MTCAPDRTTMRPTHQHLLAYFKNPQFCVALLDELKRIVAPVSANKTQLDV